MVSAQANSGANEMRSEGATADLLLLCRACRDKPQQDPAGWFNLAVVHQNRSVRLARALCCRVVL